MHVVFVCHEYPPCVAGGIGTAVASLARGLVRAGHKVSVIGFYPHSAKVDDDQGVTVHRLERYRRGRLLTWFLIRRDLRRQIVKLHKQQPIDIVEWPDWDGWWLKKVRGICDVLKLHGGRISHRVHGFGYHSPLYEYLELRMMRSIKNWIGVSQWFTNEWRAYSGAKPLREAIVYNPVDTALFRPVTQRESKVVFYSGGLRKRKGVLALAQAARRFLGRDTQVKLVMATFKADVDYGEFLNGVGKARNQVVFLPFMSQAELAPLLAQATVFAMPSLYESCGNGWIEAMSCGVPVVGSKLSCGPEIVSEGQTGFLANPDNPDEISEKVQLLLNNPELNHRLGRIARETALRRFSLEVAVKESVNFYDACLRAAGI